MNAGVQPNAAPRGRHRVSTSYGLRRVLGGVGVDRLVGPTVHAAVGLVVAGHVDALHPHATLDRRLGDRAAHGAPAAQADRLRRADVHGDDVRHAPILAGAATLPAVPTIWTVGYERLLPPRAGRRAAGRGRAAGDRRALTPPVAPAGHVEDPPRGAARRARHRLRAPP